MNDPLSQKERLSRMIRIWNMIHEDDRDSLYLGDASLRCMKWSQDDYHSRDLADMVQTHLFGKP